MMKLLDRAVLVLIGAVAIALLVTAFGQVIARYVFSRPFTWVLELDVMLLVWLTMLSGYVGVRRNLHMSVDFVVERWPPAWRRGAALCSLLLSAGFVAVFGWTSLPVVRSMEGMTFISLGIGQPWMYWSVPVGSALMIVAFAVEIGAWIRGRDRSAS